MTVNEAKSHLSSHDLMMSDESRAAVDVLLAAYEPREALVTAALAWRESMVKYNLLSIPQVQDQELLAVVAPFLNPGEGA